MILLETDRLLFRQHQLIDIDAYCAMEMDADVRRYVGGKPRTREEAEQRFLQTLKPAINKLSMWATIYKPENKYIGRCGIYPHFDSNGNSIPGEAALGLYIAKPYWGRGLATEAGHAFVKLGFNEIDINRIVTTIQVGNDASVRVIEKLGFTLEYTEQGNPRSFLHYELKKQ
ncbi:GNAT family N-acetyltransferase [Mucilaginibacter sp. X4EP1]|uniref:GNAT family N-acetyltransferase n=1 Tax=Mucilaginibacter sp. X4EP1 TaxID=2723092 RepID=UPI0021675CC9|nr:GNAT family N-acetyltransferase [Mucilaginibacter sp. X4EP1]MCS3815318.1 ribosomal-protein-alanine N-acetyltransferase [Mucilaginibacter sp. X4EP1]